MNRRELALWRRFFHEFPAPGGAAFEQWSDLERTRLRSLYLIAVARAVRERLNGGRAHEAIALARRAIELAPRQQIAWRLLIESCVAAGDISLAKVEAERLLGIV